MTTWPRFGGVSFVHPTLSSRFKHGRGGAGDLATPKAIDGHNARPRTPQGGSSQAFLRPFRPIPFLKRKANIFGLQGESVICIWKVH